MDATHRSDVSVEAPFVPRDFKHLIAQSIYEIFVKRQYAIIYIYCTMLCYIDAMFAAMQSNMLH
jgi:hypothetical protein